MFHYFHIQFCFLITFDTVISLTWHNSWFLSLELKFCKFIDWTFSYQFNLKYFWFISVGFKTTVRARCRYHGSIYTVLLLKFLHFMVWRLWLFCEIQCLKKYILVKQFGEINIRHKFINNFLSFWWNRENNEYSYVFSIIKKNNEWCCSIVPRKQRKRYYEL